MPIYLARHDFEKFQPSRWTGRYVDTFGERNEGFTFAANDMTDAHATLRTVYRLNPGLLTITLVEPAQLDLAGQQVPIPPAPTVASDPEPAPKAVQLGLDIDLPVAIRLPRGLGVAYQHTLTGGAR